MSLLPNEQIKAFPRVTSGFFKTGDATAREQALNVSPITPDQKNGKILGGTALIAGVVLAACFVTGDGDVMEGAQELYERFIPDGNDADGDVENRLGQKDIAGESVPEGTMTMGGEGAGMSAEVFNGDAEGEIDKEGLPAWEMVEVDKEGKIVNIVEDAELPNFIKQAGSYEEMASLLEKDSIHAVFYTPPEPPKQVMRGLDMINNDLSRIHKGQRLIDISKNYDKYFNYINTKTKSSDIVLVQLAFEHIEHEAINLQNAFPNHDRADLSILKGYSGYHIHRDLHKEVEYLVIRTYLGESTLLLKMSKEEYMFHTDETVEMIKPPDQSIVMFKSNVLHTGPYPFISEEVTKKRLIHAELLREK